MNPHGHEARHVSARERELFYTVLEAISSSVEAGHRVAPFLSAYGYATGPARPASSSTRRLNAVTHGIFDLAATLGGPWRAHYR